MPLSIPPGTCNVSLTMTNANGGISARNSIGLGLELIEPLTQTSVDRIANIFRDALAPLLDTSWLLGPTHFVENDGGVDKVWDNTGTEAGTGGAAQLGVTPGVALVVSKTTGLLGRAHRGRLYMPGVKEADVDEAGIVAGAFVNTAQAAFDDLHADLVADSAVVIPCLFHSIGGPLEGTTDAIESFRVRNVIGSMRPRQRR